jgi:hypothetical protein
MKAAAKTGVVFHEASPVRFFSGCRSAQPGSSDQDALGSTQGWLAVARLELTLTTRRS